MANQLARFIAELIDDELDLDRFYASYLLAPPSAMRVWPVMYRESSENRNATIAATSVSGSPKRPSGTLASESLYI